MKLKKIVITSENDDILYKVACYIYNILQFPVVSIDVINQNKAVVYYKQFVVKMKRR